jgi:hypothetical protein
MAGLTFGRSSVSGIAAGLALLLATGAQAAQGGTPAFGTLVWGGITQGTCPLASNANCFFGAGSGSLSQPATGSSAEAIASLATDMVSVNVSGDLGGDVVGSANAHALIWDTVTFSGAAAGATGILTVGGDASLSGNARMNATMIFLPFADIPSIASPDALVEGNSNMPVSSQPTYSFQESFTIQNGVAMYLAVGVDAEAGVGDSGVGQVAIEDPFNFDLPEGVTITSAYRESLSAAPEPAAWAMMLVGFTALGGVMRSRRRHAARA